MFDNPEEEVSWLQQKLEDYNYYCQNVYSAGDQLTFKEFLHYYNEEQKTEALREIAEAIRFSQTPLKEIAEALEVISMRLKPTTT
jgi:hypothetical protein